MPNYYVVKMECTTCGGTQYYAGKESAHNHDQGTQLGKDARAHMEAAHTACTGVAQQRSFRSGQSKSQTTNAIVL